MKPEAVLVAVLALGVPAAAVAERAAPSVAQAATPHKGEGTVRKVDEAAGSFNISHGPIPSLKWPAMTMDFQVKDKAILKDIKPGQKVEIAIVQEGPSKFVVTHIKPLN